MQAAMNEPRWYDDIGEVTRELVAWANRRRHGGFYFASKVKHSANWRALRKCGIPVVSTWIDEAEEGQTVDYAELSSRCITEIRSASALVLYCEPGEVLKGALIEAGVALAFGIPVYCVGTCESLSRVFAKHPLWHSCETVRSAIDAACDQ